MMEKIKRFKTVGVCMVVGQPPLESQEAAIISAIESQKKNTKVVIVIDEEKKQIGNPIFNKLESRDFELTNRELDYVPFIEKPKKPHQNKYTRRASMKSKW